MRNASSDPARWSALALLLGGCEAGLDLRTPSDAREYVRLCALGREDISCGAMRPTLRTVPGPVTVIMPNLGDDDRRKLLTALLAQPGATVSAFMRDEAVKAAFTRANVFALSRLTTGTRRTLDGRAHEVVCGPDGGLPEHLCRIDGLEQHAPRGGCDRRGLHDHGKDGRGPAVLPLLNAQTGAPRADLKAR